MSFEDNVLRQLDVGWGPNQVDPRELYAALCNRGWTDGTQAFHCSWRAAGSYVDEVSLGTPFNTGDHMAYYLSGGEGVVSEGVEAAICDLGWFPCESDVALALERPDDRVRFLGRLRFLQWARGEGIRVGAVLAGLDGSVTFKGDRDYHLDIESGAVLLDDDEEVLGPIEVEVFLAEELAASRAGLRTGRPSDGAEPA